MQSSSNSVWLGCLGSFGSLSNWSIEIEGDEPEAMLDIEIP